MYEFCYHYIQYEYGITSKLLFIYTDSLMCKIKTGDVYEDFRNHKEMFDFSNYSTRSKYYDNSNQLVIGKTKDQTAGGEEFDGLKPQVYSYLVDENSGKKKVKTV